VVYTAPEWAGVGLTEEEAKKAGYRVRVGRFPLAASGRALTLGAPEGLVKVVADEETDLLLGVFIVGPQAGELIAEATLALEMGATLTDLALTVHAHPTLSEGLMEAAEAFHRRAIHILNR
jgi:dihydrolipoamide dehydrogenase